MLFNEMRQYNLQIFNKYIFLKYRTKQLKAIETNNHITYTNWLKQKNKNKNKLLNWLKIRKKKDELKQPLFIAYLDKINIQFVLMY